MKQFFNEKPAALLSNSFIYYLIDTVFFHLKNSSINPKEYDQGNNRYQNNLTIYLTIIESQLFEMQSCCVYHATQTWTLNIVYLYKCAFLTIGLQVTIFGFFRSKQSKQWYTVIIYNNIDIRLSISNDSMNSFNFLSSLGCLMAD